LDWKTLILKGIEEIEKSKIRHLYASEELELSQNITHQFEDLKEIAMKKIRGWTDFQNRVPQSEDSLDCPEKDISSKKIRIMRFGRRSWEKPRCRLAESSLNKVHFSVSLFRSLPQIDLAFLLSSKPLFFFKIENFPIHFLCPCKM